jgi:hypothetical protein
MCCVYLFIIVVFVWRPSVAQNSGLWRRLRRWFVSAYFARKICYEAVLSHLRYYPRIYLEKLSKTSRCLSQVRLSRQRPKPAFCRIRVIKDFTASTSVASCHRQSTNPTFEFFISAPSLLYNRHTWQRPTTDSFSPSLCEMCGLV